MTETAFLQYTGYVLAFFAVWIVARCARSMLSERYVPEVWGYLELPDGTSRAIEHWECILGRAKASDIVLTGEGIERSHAAIQRSGAGEWTLSALDGGRVFLLLVTWVIERITKKRLDPKYEGYIHAAGMVLLLALMAYIMFNDIVRIVTK